MSDLTVIEGIQEQHPDEVVVRTVDFAVQTEAASVSSPVVTAYDEEDESDVTSTVFPTNSPTASGTVVTLSALRALTEGRIYRIEVKCSDGTNTLVNIHRVKCTRG